MTESVDPEVGTALERLGWPLRAFLCLSKLPPSAGRRIVYRLELENGSIVKARRLESAAVVQRLVEVRGQLPDSFAPVLTFCGSVLFEEWIDGEAVGDPVPEATLIEAASLLAQLHATSAVAGRAVHDRRSTSMWRAEADSALREIVAANALGEDMTDRIAADLDRLDPGRAIFGLVHTDFCGENMLIDRSARLRVIDNERVGVDALGFDLARTWYRWALPAAAWERVLATYLAQVPLAEPLEAFDFWSLVVLAHSAALRLRTDPSKARAPLDLLRRLAAPTS